MCAICNVIVALAHDFFIRLCDMKLMTITIVFTD